MLLLTVQSNSSADRSMFILVIETLCKQQFANRDNVILISLVCTLLCSDFLEDLTIVPGARHYTVINERKITVKLPYVVF